MSIYGWAWVIFLVVSMWVCLFGVPKLPKLPKREPREEIDPWASWKRYKAKDRAKELELWQAEFDRLLQP